MSKICKKRVHGNDKKNLPWDSKKCTGSLHFTLLVSVSYLDQILERRESQTGQVFNFAGIQFRDFVVLKLFAGTKFRENGQKSGNLIPLKYLC